ncbi:hypothetical protein [Gimesia maris]|jgi:hypothetical protein|uniref:Uncharacterized protein n=1 Tax=Gimesia maris TaxID=122 RepID=A0A3D3R6K9_9PLAN|nr:hypothetical protein [Gimesia maris]MAC52241.1 hypothetical protein [Gimesia sp.]EDL56724.1 hypothetical protein PM8797T_06447 [Gimesia maris DSM 8797]QDT77131.1 hypothetical protein Mal35_05560 [Gimesia maris]QEG14706.1 hypothetical protein GmarT_05420 [Gimesia maris]QGQ31898.1 hypothetical protein F1729_26485 [Gimesia maris]|tara:strand:- start:21748 stop:22251 length:504 start_codon:yes stop_codon:yes gene_type:complete
MRQAVRAYPSDVFPKTINEDENSEFYQQKRDAFLRETTNTPCLRRIPELNKLIDSVVASWYLEPSSISSREWHRIPCRRPLGLAVFNPQTRQLESDLQIVTGRNISVRGISFTHQAHIYSREVAVTFDLDQPVQEFLIVRLAWSRFSEKRTFQSGGQFLSQIEVAAE